MKVKMHLLENWLLLPLYLSILGMAMSYAKTTAKLSNATPKPGDDVVLMCITSPAGGRFALFSHTKKFKEDSPQQKWITLARMLDPVTTVPIVAEGRYSVSSKFAGTPVVEHYNLTIKNVKFADSGFLGCAYKDTQKNIDESDFDKLLVLVDGKSVEFSEYQNNTDFIDYEDFKGKKNLKLTCIATGTIPGEQILLLGRTNITADGITTVVETGFKQVGVTGGAKSSWTSTLVYDKPFTSYMIGKSISCQYETRGFAMKKTVVHLQSKVIDQPATERLSEIKDIMTIVGYVFAAITGITTIILTVLLFIYRDKAKTYCEKKCACCPKHNDEESVPLTAKVTPVISSITTTEAKLTWDAPTQKVKSYTVLISPTTDGALADPSSIGKSDPLKSTLRNLTAGTEYTVTVTAVTKEQKQGVQSDETFTTEPNRVDGTKITCVGITTERVCVKWSAPGGRVTSYDISINPESDGAQIHSQSVLADDELKADLESLLAGTKYTVSITSIADGEKSKFPATTTFTTAPNPVDGTTICINSITTTSAEVRWNAPDGGLTSYEIDVNPKPGDYGAYPLTVLKEATRILDLQSLTAGTEYTVSITTEANTQRSRVPTTKTFTTEPNRVEAISIEDVKTTTACVKWSPPSGNVTSYDVSISPETDGAQIHPQSDGQLERKLTSLLAGTRYTVFITSKAGEKSSSQVKATFVTEPNPVVEKTIIIDPKITSARIRWDEPPIGGWTSYELSISPTSGGAQPYPQTVPEGAPLTSALRSLTAGTVYTVTINTEAHGKRSKETSTTFSTDKYKFNVTYETAPKRGPKSFEWVPSEDFNKLKEAVRNELQIEEEFYFVSIEPGETDYDISTNKDVEDLLERQRQTEKKPSLHAFPGKPWILTLAGTSYPLLTEPPGTDTDLVCCMKKEYLEFINLDKVETFLMLLVPILKKAYYNLIMSEETNIAADLYGVSAGELSRAIQGSKKTVEKFEGITSSNLTSMTRIFTALSRNSELFAAKEFLDTIREKTKTMIGELTTQEELLDKARGSLEDVRERTKKVARQDSHSGDNRLNKAKKCLDDSIQYITFVSAVIDKIKQYWSDVEDMVNDILGRPCFVSLHAALSERRNAPGTLGEKERRVEQRTELFMKDGIGLMARLVAMQDIFNEAFGYLKKLSGELDDFKQTHVECPDATTAEGRLSSTITKTPINKEFKTPSLDPDKEVLIHTYYELKYKILNAAKPGTGDQADPEAPEQADNSAAEILVDAFIGLFSGAQASD